MEKEKDIETTQQDTPTVEGSEKTHFQNFLDRLTIFQPAHRPPIRKWMAWLGVILFIALVIAYYATNGG